MTRRILVCLEGANWAELSSRVDAGELAAFASVMERGSCGALGGGASPSMIASAISLATGRQAARHGILAPRIAEPDPDQVRLVLAADRKAPTLWDILVATGTVSQSVGWPASHGSRPLDGAAISDFFGNPLVSQDRPVSRKRLHSKSCGRA